MLIVQEITRILQAIETGDRQAAAELLPAVYEELRRLAARKMAQEAPGNTLQATDLVHEAYLRLTKQDSDKAREPSWDSRGHFFAAAAEAMRRILIDRARAKGTVKRGGGWKRLSLDSTTLCVDDSAEELIDFDGALNKLAEEDPVKADLVKLRFYAGLGIQDAASALGISIATADRYWAYARAWLFDELSESGQYQG